VEKNKLGMPCQKELSFCQRLLAFRRPGASRLAYVSANGCWPSGGRGQAGWHMRERVDLKSPVREYRSPGSVRGAPGNRRPYLDKAEIRGRKAESENQGH
jgi:hypothetical protein